MTNRSSPHPPNWRLWHPTNGVVFQQQQQQQPLYPALDVARFSTETSTAREVGEKTDPIQPVQPARSKSYERQPYKSRFATPNQTTSKPPLRRPNSNPNASKSTTSEKKEWRTGEKIDWRPRTSHTDSASGQNTRTTSSKVKTSSSPYLPKPGEKPASAEEKTQGFRTLNTDPATVEDLSAKIAALNVAEDVKIMKDVPFTPLDFKMSQETFQAAQQAAKGNPNSFWSHTQYRRTNEGNDGTTKNVVQVSYCRSSKTAEEAVQVFVGEKLLGLDLEWYSQANKKSGIRKNVSLMQIASASHVVLLHLALYPEGDDFITPTLRKLLEDPEIRKTGVFITGDCTRIKTYLDVECQGKFELSHLYKQVKYSASGEKHLIDKKLVALAKQIEAIMGLPMKKDNNVRASDWSKPLNAKQLQYAASDAYAGVQLFAMMNHQRESLDPCPDLPFHAELNMPIPGSEAPPTVALAEDKISDGKKIDSPEEALNKKKARAKEVDTKSAMKTKVSKAVQATIAAQFSKVDPPPQTKDKRIEAAEAWLQEFRTQRKIKTAPAALRAYHVWHNNKDLDCKSIAKMLRNPPIQASSVAGYILSSVQTEKLPYDKERAKQVMSNLPPDLAKKRFWGVWVAVNTVKGIEFEP